MSETIQGTKSSLYIKEEVPGVNNSSDTMTHQSVQNLWGGRGAADVLIHGFFALSINNAIEAGSVKRKIKITTHGAKAGDFILLEDGNALGEEVAIIKVIDADYFIIAKEINAAVGDLASLLRAVTPSYNQNGSLNVVASMGSAQYDRKTGGITTSTKVLEDLDTPANSRALPVVIHGLDAAVVTVTGNQINIASDHVSDSIKIGDGTTLAGVTVGNELKVSLPAAQVTTLTPPVAITNFANETGGNLAEIKTNTDNIPALGQALEAASVPVVLTAAQISTLTPPAAITGFALETGGSLANIKTNTDKLDVNLSTVATATKQDAHALLFGAVTETAPANDTASSGLNGRLQRIAQRLTSLIGQIPATLGITTAANSLSIAPASDAKFSVKPATTTSTYAENLALTTVTTITAPANAVAVVVWADGSNANNIRVRQGGSAASLTSGFPLEAGRDFKFDCGTDLSVISDAAGSAGASVKVYFNWYIQA